MVDRAFQITGRSLTLALLVVFLMGLVSSAQALETKPSLSDLNLYRVADMSSPRATLKSFLVLSEDAIRSWQSAGNGDRVYALLSGLEDTLDFSTTVNGSQALEQVRRILMMREVLDRLDLPAWSDVPGAEAAAQDLESWTVPGTLLRIQRVKKGNRAGDYIFAADTVADLQLTYNRVRTLPYRRGTGPVLEQWELNETTATNASNEIEDHLSRIDTSSPRAILTSVLKYTNLAYGVAMDAEARLKTVPPTIPMAEAMRANDVSAAYLRRASAAFDLRSVPKSQLEDTGVEAVLMLKEILDRVVLPPIHEIPDAAMVGAQENKDEPYVWRFPGLPIKITRIESGERIGAFTFDQTTLRTLPDTYERLKDLPPVERLPLRSSWEYNGADALSPGFYDFYISTPGRLVPSASLLGALVGSLPDWMNTLRGGQTTWQWLGLVMAVTATFAASAATQLFSRKLLRDRKDLKARWMRLLPPVLMIVVFVSLRRFVDHEVNITGYVQDWFVAANRIVVLALVTWVIWLFFMALSECFARTGLVSRREIDVSLLRILGGVAAIVAGIAVIVSGLRDLGVDAVPLIAGLGVGGLAVALAIRPTLENLIGGLIIHSDRPVRIGDYCSVGGISGNVETIGVRSTQIRALDRTLVSIPNSRLADMDIVNWAKCDRMLINETLNMRFETSPDQMRHVLAAIRHMLHAHPKVDSETIRVRYLGPVASSRDIGVRIHIKTREWNEFYAVREDVFLRIDDLVERSGVGYAFPSQTLYLAQDRVPDQERGAAAEREVNAWRSENRMPFPVLDEQTIADLEGTLDYPPVGSNGFVHGEQLTEPVAEPLSSEEEPAAEKERLRS